MQVDDDLRDLVPCSALAVDSTIRLGTAGLIWGFVRGPYEARQLGLTGVPKSLFVVKAAASSGFQCGLFAGIYCSTRCALQKYRMRKDLLNATIAGAFTGALIAARTRSFRQIRNIALVVSAITTASEFVTTI